MQVILFVRMLPASQTVAVDLESIEESPGSTEQERQVTPGGRKSTESATEKIPPFFHKRGKGEMVR